MILRLQPTPEFRQELDGLILEEGSPNEIFSSPKEPRTQQFLERIIEAGRL